ARSTSTSPTPTWSRPDVSASAFGVVVGERDARVQPDQGGSAASAGHPAHHLAGALARVRHLELERGGVANTRPSELSPSPPAVPEADQLEGTAARGQATHQLVFGGPGSIMLAAFPVDLDETAQRGRVAGLDLEGPTKAAL